LFLHQKCVKKKGKKGRKFAQKCASLFICVGLYFGQRTQKIFLKKKRRKMAQLARCAKNCNECKKAQAL